MVCTWLSTVGAPPKTRTRLQLLNEPPPGRGRHALGGARKGTALNLCLRQRCRSSEIRGVIIFDSRDARQQQCPTSTSRPSFPGPAAATTAARRPSTAAAHRMYSSLAGVESILLASWREAARAETAGKTSAVVRSRKSMAPHVASPGLAPEETREGRHYLSRQDSRNMRRQR